MPDPTPQTLYETLLYVQATHLSTHGDALRVRLLPLPFLDCATCQAIQGALGLAHALVETTATPRRRART
jgi:hypothetical protein